MITVYSFKEKRPFKQSKKLIRELTFKLAKKDIHPAALTETEMSGEQQDWKNSKMIPGSHYICYRNDDNVAHKNPFEGINLTKSLSGLVQLKAVPMPRSRNDSTVSGTGSIKISSGIGEVRSGDDTSEEENDTGTSDVKGKATRFK